MQTEELMKIALRAGEILLTSGAEIYRVEDTITRICESYDTDCESVVLPTGIFISLSGGSSGTLSVTKRVKSRTVDLHRIELVNTFSRNLRQKPLSYPEAVKKLDEIENVALFNFLIRLASVWIGAFAFTLLFRGNAGEGMAASFISLLIYVVKEIMGKAGIFQFFENFITGVAAAGLSMAAVKVWGGLNVYKVIIGAIVIYVPGVAITNSIKDALHGDSVSSLSRLGEAVFVAVAIGAGVGVTLSIGLR